MDRCPNCPSRNLPEELQKRPIPGDLDNKGGVLFVGEGPGRQENNMRRVFVGPTGEELNRVYLPRAGMSRGNINITNACKCHWADTGDAPPDELVKSCSDFHLSREIEETNPSLIVLMGGSANSLMDWDVEMEHGIMHEDCKLYGYRGRIYSTFHPALGMHKSSKMQALLDDFRDLRSYMRDEIQPLKSLCPNPVYERLYLPSQVRSICSVGNYMGAIGVDTESIKRWNGFKPTIRYTPDRTTFCIEPPYAYLIMRKDEDAMSEFGTQIRKFRKLYFQNLPHDDWALAQMGVHVPTNHVFDTMSGAYHNGALPKGLKALGYRLAGIRMTSFDEIVVPYAYERALYYLSEANLRAWPKPIQEWTGELVTRNCKDCKGKGVLSVGRGKARKQYACDCTGGKVEARKMTGWHSLNQSLSGVFTALKKGEVKVWDRWESWTEKDHLIPAVVEMISKMRGPLPLPSIDYVPDEPAMVYACGDALVTRLVGPIIERKNSEIRRAVRESK